MRSMSCIRLATLSLVGLGVALGVGVVHAQLVDLGVVAVGTAGEPADASLIAVSNGGSATARGPLNPLCPGPRDSCSNLTSVAAVSTSGSAYANGAGVAVSVSGCSTGGVAVTQNGCADSGNLAVSGTGSANGTSSLSSALSVQGSATAGLVAISATGPATACGGPVNFAFTTNALFGGMGPQSCPYNLPIPIPVSLHTSIVSTN